MRRDYDDLKKLILERFGTYTKFSEASGYSNAQISQKLSGKINLSQTDMEKWADVLGIKKQYFGRYFFDLKIKSNLKRGKKYDCTRTNRKVGKVHRQSTNKHETDLRDGWRYEPEQSYTEIWSGDACEIWRKEREVRLHGRCGEHDRKEEV